MASVNKVTILGNLGRDPESRTLPSGEMVTNITVATTDKWKDKNTNEAMEATEWHRISFFGRLAEIANQYLHKGDPVYVEGSLRTRQYTDKDGVEKYTTDIKASSMQLLGSRPDGGGQGGGQQRQAPAPQQQSNQGQQRQQNNNQGNNRQQAAPQRQAAPQQQGKPNQGGGGGNTGSGFEDFDDTDIPF